jgi:hypothetical protein
MIETFYMEFLKIFILRNYHLFYWAFQWIQIQILTLVLASVILLKNYPSIAGFIVSVVNAVIWITSFGRLKDAFKFIPETGVLLTHRDVERDGSVEIHET